MKMLLRWSLLSVASMIGCPWLAVRYAGSAGMAICFLLFYAVNPLFSAVCGAAAGKNIEKLWILPILTPVLFLTGTWLFFEMGEPAFLLYGGIYLAIGIIAMLIRWVLGRRMNKKTI